MVFEFGSHDPGLLINVDFNSSGTARLLFIYLLAAGIVKEGE
jgi:hypothetical protein